MSFYHIVYKDVNAEMRRQAADRKQERKLRREHAVHNSDDSLTVRMRNDDDRFIGFVELPVSEWAKTLIL